jgi:molybdenum cofactor biosynthesis protein B
MMNDPVAEHKNASPGKLRCAVITVSDTRTVDTDQGGAIVVQLLQLAGHHVEARQIIPDEPKLMQSLLEGYVAADLDAVLLTGGTGVTRRDQTFETVSRLLDKPLPGYGELFRMLSYQEIGAAAMLSRAVAGICRSTVVITMPGSPAGVRLAMQTLIIPELRHLVGQARQ